MGGEDGLDDEMYNREGSGAGTDSKRKGCTKARSLLPSAWTQPHVPPLPTHDSPHDSFVDVLRGESVGNLRGRPPRGICNLCPRPSLAHCMRCMRIPRRPQLSRNQASSHGAQHGALSRRTKHRLPPRLCLQCLVDRLRRFIPQRSTSRRFHARAVHLTSVNSQRICPPQRLEPVALPHVALFPQHRLRAARRCRAYPPACEQTGAAVKSYGRRSGTQPHCLKADRVDPTVDPTAPWSVTALSSLHRADKDTIVEVRSNTHFALELTT